MENKKIREYFNSFNFIHIPSLHTLYSGPWNDFEKLSLRHFLLLSTRKTQKLSRMTQAENTVYIYIHMYMYNFSLSQREIPRMAVGTYKMSQLFLGGHFHLSDKLT